MHVLNLFIDLVSTPLSGITYAVMFDEKSRRNKDTQLSKVLYCKQLALRTSFPTLGQAGNRKEISGWKHISGNREVKNNNPMINLFQCKLLPVIT